ncbi:MAG: hypothetical protein OEM46_07725, partial [Ignavibacteria bacterium]|nr:hypothetical protein [Ignavibacteria bacterium]
ANLFDGIIIVEQADIALFDGRLIVKDAALDLFNGLLIIKDSSTVLLDGKLIITSGTTIVKFDGKLRVLSAIPNRPHDVFINKKVSDFIV